MKYSELTIHQKINNKSWWGLKKSLAGFCTYTSADIYSTYTRSNKKIGVRDLKRMGRIK